MKIARESLADSVHKIVLSRLLSGEIEPGESINIDALARDLSVSQTPVREALARIVESGLVERIPHVGYRAVMPFTRKQLSDTLHARLVIEPALAELAASHVTPEALLQLEGKQRQLAARISDGPSSPTADSVEGSKSFHEIIAALADNELLSSAYRVVNGQALRIRLLSMQEFNDEREVLDEHAAIIEALRAGSGPQAREAMRAHIEAITRRTVSLEID